MTERVKSEAEMTCFEYGSYWLAENEKYLKNSHLTSEMRKNVLSNIERAKEYIAEGERSYADYSAERGERERAELEALRKATLTGRHRQAAFDALGKETRLAVSTLKRARSLALVGECYPVFNYSEVSQRRVHLLLRPRYFLYW